MNTPAHVRSAILAIVFLTISVGVQARPKPVSLAPREGFWVVETTPKSRQCTVRFYSDEKKLIYEETIDRCLNIARRQTKRRLNAALEQSLFVWNATHKMPTDRQWVAVQFEKK